MYTDLTNKLISETLDCSASRTFNSQVVSLCNCKSNGILSETGMGYLLTVLV